MVPVNVETRGETTAKPLAREGKLSVRQDTARTVNDELHSLESSLRKITLRLQSKPGDPKLMALQARQEAMLQTVINAALEGRKWRHRSQVGHANHGLRTNRNMSPLWSVTNR